MWRNKSNWKRNRGGGFHNRRQGEQYKKRDQQHDRSNSRDKGNWSVYEERYQDDRNFRQGSREYVEEQPVEIGIEIGDGSSYDRRQDAYASSFEMSNEYNDNFYRDRDVDARNVVIDSRHYDDFRVTRRDNYWDDRRSQEGDLYSKKEELKRSDDYYGRPVTGRVDNENIDRYDRNFSSGRSETRTELHIHGRHESKSSHPVDNDSKTQYEERLSHETRTSRRDWKDKKSNENKLSFESGHRKDPKWADKYKHSSLSSERSHSSKRNSTDIKESYGKKSNIASEVVVHSQGSKRNESKHESIQHNKTDSRKGIKKSIHKSDKKSERKSTVDATKNKSNAKTHEDKQLGEAEERNSSVTASKHASSVKVSKQHSHDKTYPTISSSSSFRKEEKSSLDRKDRHGQKHSSESSKDKNKGFKKPTEKHQSRKRSSSGRKLESDIGHVHEEDILSIMADDDGFEHEMRLYNKTGSDNNASRHKESTEHRIPDMSFHRSSRERGSWDCFQHGRDNMQTLTSSKEYNPNEELEFEIHADESKRNFGEAPETDSKYADSKSFEPNNRTSDFRSPTRTHDNRTSDFRSPTRTSDFRSNRQTTSSSRFRFYGNQNMRQSSRNNNYVGGRARLSVASKIKDSYFKRRNTNPKHSFKGTARKEGNEPDRFYYVQRNSKNEIGKTGAILKDDRVRGNTMSLDLGNRNQNKFFEHREKDNRNKFFSFTQKSGNHERSKFHKGKESHKVRGSTYERVKRKYFRGGFRQNRNDSRYRDDKKDLYVKPERTKNERVRKQSDENEHMYSHAIDKDSPNISQPLGDPSISPGQQVVFIPNSDMQVGQPHLIDQFGQIILNPDVDSHQGEPQVPVQYLQQQFHPDGEQVVFIPFVNNQTQPEYTENVTVQNEENPEYSYEGKKLSEDPENKNISTRKAYRGKKPLSSQARAKIRKHLEFKRKQRLEKMIEEKVLRKLLRNPDITKAMTENKLNTVKKKPFIKRISPPDTSKSGQSNQSKRPRLVKKGTDDGDFEDISEDENKYDSVSDLEDVSDYEDVSEGNDEFESQKPKRPGFRKPGQPRKSRNIAEGSMGASSSGDIRKVVDQTSRYSQKARSEQNKAKQMSNQNQKTGRSVYIDNSDDEFHHKKQSADRLENKVRKKQRSISPIEITVSNDRYSKFKYKRSGSDKEDYGLDSRTEKVQANYTRRHSNEGKSEGRYDRTRNDRNSGSSTVKYSKKYDGTNTEKLSHEDQITVSDKKWQYDRTEQKYSHSDKSYHSGSDTEGKTGIDYPGSKSKYQRKSGKYDSKKETSTGELKDKHEHAKERRQSKTDNLRERESRRDERRHTDEDDRDSWYSESKRSDMRDLDRHNRYNDSEWRNDKETKSRDRSKESRNEGRSLSRDRNVQESRTDTLNAPVYDRNRKRNTVEEQGSSGGILRNNFVSSVSQGQFQMNQPLMQHSVQPQQFITAQSQGMPLQNQFSNSGNFIDHSLPPVQNTQVPMPPMPTSSLGVRPDMSLPPPVMNVGGTPSSMVIQQPNNVHFQQQSMNHMNMQQQFQQIQPQFQQQQQQFQQMQQQPQIMQQQPNAPQFQSNQSVFQTNLQSNQMPVQPMQSGQFQHNSNIGMMQSCVNQQSVSVNQSASQGSRAAHGIMQTSMNQPTFVATTAHKAVRGMVGRVRVAPHMSQVSQSSSVARKPVSSSRMVSNMYQDDLEEEEEEDDYLAEMLCSKCDKVFLSHEVMRRHGKWHDMIESNSKSWRCDQCEQGFASSSGHTEHMATKHGRDSWNCSLCDMTFSNSSGLNKHVRNTSHKDMKVKFVCSLCPASFMVLMHLVQHKKENHQSSAGFSGLRKY